MTAGTPGGGDSAPRTAGGASPDREELLRAELEVLGHHLADATATIARLRTRLLELEAQEARSVRGRLRRLVDRLLGVPAPRPLSAELPPAPVAPPGSAAPTVARPSAGSSGSPGTPQVD